MSQKKIKEWLKERHLVCEENFGEAMYKLALDHSEKTGLTLSEIWRELGVSKQCISHWKNDLPPTMKTNYARYYANEKAGKLFSLTKREKENLTTKVGINKNIDESEIFIERFKELLNLWNGSQQELYENAGIGKRTFYNIKSGKKLRKDTLLALFIVMGLSESEVKEGLKLAGFYLSNSSPRDLVISHSLENDLKNVKGAMRLEAVNTTLYELNQPLLEVRGSKD